MNPCAAALLVALAGAVCLPGPVLAQAPQAQGPQAQGPRGQGKPQLPMLNTLRDVGIALQACWVPPPLDKARPGTQVTVQFTFTRDGEILGEPRFTFVTPGIAPEMRTAYQLSVADALTRCTPLPLTPGLGNAIAGRPFTMRYVDTRGQRGAERRPWPTTKTS